MKKSYKYLPLLLLLLLALNSCIYDYIAKEEVPVVDPTVSILFGTQIAPIYANKCISCHKVGGQSPDLTAANAFNSIKSLVNTTTPETSKIYTYPNPANTANHSWTKYSAAEAQLLLTWIQQGAKNN